MFEMPLLYLFDGIKEVSVRKSGDFLVGTETSPFPENHIGGSRETSSPAGTVPVSGKSCWRKSGDFLS